MRHPSTKYAKLSTLNNELDDNTINVISRLGHKNSAFAYETNGVTRLTLVLTLSPVPTYTHTHTHAHTGAHIGF